MKRKSARIKLSIDQWHIIIRLLRLQGTSNTAAQINRQLPIDERLP